MSSAPLTSVDFRRALGEFATGVVVVTAERETGQIHGMTANSFTSVSLVPPLVSICVDERAHLLPLLKERRVFGISVLRESQRDLSEFFARPHNTAGRELPVNFVRSAEGVPLLDHVLCQISCRLHAVHPAGDHSIVVGDVLCASWRSGEPLLYFRGDYARLSR